MEYHQGYPYPVAVFLQETVQRSRSKGYGSSFLLHLQIVVIALYTVSDPFFAGWLKAVQKILQQCEQSYRIFYDLGIEMFLLSGSSSFRFHSLKEERIQCHIGFGIRPERILTIDVSFIETDRLQLFLIHSIPPCNRSRHLPVHPHG